MPAIKHAINTAKARDALTPRKSPYWHKLSKGCHLGFRKISRSAPGAWQVKYRDDDGKTTEHSLGSFDTAPPGERFDLAKKAAEQWLAHMGKGGSTGGETVADACREYVKNAKPTTGKDAEARFKRWVYSDPIGKLALMKLRHADVMKWRKRLEAAPVIRQDRQASDKARSASSINRDMNSLRAALNAALIARLVTSDEAWKVALRPAKNADNRRNVYLTPEHRRKLIDAAPDDLKPFLTVLSAIPLRPGAMAALKAGDWNPRTRELNIQKDKTGARRIRLPEGIAALFTQASKDKLPGAPLFVRAGGKAWDKDAWKYPINDAAKAANLPAGTVMYSLRHATITDMVSAGVDMATVAKLAGTSLAMIAKHYAHLQQDRASAAIDSIGRSIGIT
ncbi:tyrosine-type recombinase/integrase [Hydrogenophaga sp.]|uniref:tyrosine-type recombinase/integrase n=1 Tax=Hydrogenophaga sp. TaxID=1904254 RepID=UPI002C0ECF21|nr:tyrosine-type recombinase/integrase [Hydrogenophaga sp.]HMP11181.1 tyrosine-type recombinase/integrase [Hydrogenophaga sp.]